MDFNELREYNDYLEQVEDIIFNLCEGIDVKATEAKVDAYRKENAGEIARLNKRNEEEDRRIAEASGSEWAPRRMSMDELLNRRPRKDMPHRNCCYCHWLC